MNTNKPRSGMLAILGAGEYGFFERAVRIFTNVGRKVVRRELCCGNYGEPGC
ncbi:MAG TPA: hypothetical protein VF383_13705 [Candidatus Dormibacteraeota bacterium]